jgi:hypothetical protein
MLTMETTHNLWGSMTWHRVFSSRSDVWGSFKCLAKLNGDLATYSDIELKDVVICHGAVYWLDHHRETTMVRVCHGHTHKTDVEVAFCTIVRGGLKCRPARGCCHAGVCR